MSIQGLICGNGEGAGTDNNKTDKRTVMGDGKRGETQQNMIASSHGVHYLKLKAYHDISGDYY